MKKLLLLFVILTLTLVAHVNAAHSGSITFGWSYDFIQNPDVNIFRLYRDGTPVLDIPRGDCNVTETPIVEMPAPPDVTFPCTNGPGTCTNNISYKVICGEQMGCSTAPSDYTLTAVDEAGHESEPSNSVHVDQPPEPVTTVNISFK